MSFSYSKRSRDILKGTHPWISDILYEAINYIDLKPIESVRLEERQDFLFEMEQTQVRYPDSFHNPDNPKNLDPDGKYRGVKALDVLPWPFDPQDWKIHDKFYVMWGILSSIAIKQSSPLTWGGDWNNNGIYSTDPKQNFFDLPHIQARGW